MKKYIVLGLLLNVVGITSLQAVVSWKRAWQCRNFGKHGTPPQSTQQRLSRNKCTQEEIGAGREMGIMIALGGGYLAFFGPVGAVAGAAAYVDHRAQKKLKENYGENWKNFCNEIVNDKDMPGDSREECRRILQQRETLGVRGIKLKKQELREGGAWSGTSPLQEKN